MTVKTIETSHICLQSGENSFTLVVPVCVRAKMHQIFHYNGNDLILGMLNTLVSFLWKTAVINQMHHILFRLTKKKTIYIFRFTEDWLKTCQIDDPNFEACSRESVQGLFKQLTLGEYKHTHTYIVFRSFV